MKYQNFLKNLFAKSSKNLKEKAIKDLDGNEIIEIDGKEYIKVRLKFVETLNYSTTKQNHDLEIANNYLEKQNLKITEQNEFLNTQNKALQNFNQNLVKTQYLIAKPQKELYKLNEEKILNQRKQIVYLMEQLEKEKSIKDQLINSNTILLEKKRILKEKLITFKNPISVNDNASKALELNTNKEINKLKLFLEEERRISEKLKIEIITLQKNYTFLQQSINKDEKRYMKIKKELNELNDALQHKENIIQTLTEKLYQ